MLVDEVFFVANVGDSRAIMVGRGDSITPLSTDQTPYRRVRDAKSIKSSGVA